MKVSRQTTLRYLAAAVFLLLGFQSDVVRADFPSAVQAYDAGDYETAAALWRDLAEQCDPQAQTALAGLYHNGLGVPQSDVEAVRWYLMAARSGERFAQQVVGDWYARGHIVSSDQVRATVWFTLAAEQGLRWSAVQRDTLLADLDARQRQLLQQQLAVIRAADETACRLQ